MNKENFDRQNDSDERNQEELNYEDYIKREIIKETFVNKECNTERIAFLMSELNRIDPPNDTDAGRLLEDFYKKYPVESVSTKKRYRTKKIAVAVAASFCIMTVGAMAVLGNKYNWFDMFVQFGNSDNIVQYSSEGNEQPEALDTDIESSLHFKSIEEVKESLAFAFMIPQYIPNGFALEDVQVDKNSADQTNICITYSAPENFFVREYISYTEEELNKKLSKNYEDDYKIEDTLFVNGQECVVIDDGYNISCTFSVENAIYSIVATQSISLSEFEKIVQSIE